MTKKFKDLIHVEMPLYEIGFLAFILSEHKEILKQKISTLEDFERNTSIIFLNKVEKLEQFFTDLQSMNKQEDKK